jgi:hypothetical protein
MVIEGLVNDQLLAFFMSDGHCTLELPLAVGSRIINHTHMHWLILTGSLKCKCTDEN